MAPGGLEDAATIRAQRGQEILQMKADIAELVRHVEESVRDSMLEIRAEVQANTDGEFQPGDLGSVIAASNQIKGRLIALANSFTP